jgi:hypothetical protein
MLEPIIEEVGDILVVRDDVLPGGTKSRALSKLLRPGKEYVYATPAYGYAQIALAITCRQIGAKATVFVAKRKELHPRTMEAKIAGASIQQVPNGYMNVVKARAREYCETYGATLLPFGLDFEDMRQALKEVALSIKISPSEVWTVAGSGTLSRSLQMAWPNAKFRAIRIGAQCNVGKAVLFTAPEKFEESAKASPPFPSCDNYDAKAWQFIRKYAKPGALFWNVAA